MVVSNMHQNLNCNVRLSYHSSLFGGLLHVTAVVVVAVSGKATAADNVAKQEPTRRRLEKCMLINW
jgi:hypothetical protein